MRYLALATDYDGTLAHDGVVNEKTIQSLQRFRESGRRLILVTGRELPDLESVFPRLDLFERVVAENGAVLFNPATRDKRLLAQRPPEAFIYDLKIRRVEPMSVGEVIVATWHPHETVVVESIRRFGLELQVIFNKDAVMILPSGTNKMTGLNHALEDMKLSVHNIAGVGDAENDHAFLACCECSAAVRNAIPALEEIVDLVTENSHGEGVAELIDRILTDDLNSLQFRPERNAVLLGHAADRDLYVSAHGRNILLCGQSGSGKSTFVAGFVERLLQQGYQTCLIDPEGDYQGLEGFLTVGDESHPPSIEQTLQLLDYPKSNLIINLLGVNMGDRPGFFGSLLARLQEKTLREARPHWLIIDEAHHLLPSEWEPASAEVAGQTASMLLVTVHPEHVSPAALRLAHIVAVIGKRPNEIASEFAKTIGVEKPEIPPDDLEVGEATFWFRDTDEVLDRVKTEAGRAERKRHKRKYAEGELEPERLFFFRGPGDRLKLRVQNLKTFLQIAEGVDDETWLFHLRQGDYSRWFGLSLKDKDLAAEVERVEQDGSLSPVESRKQIANAIESRYTAPV